ncbi:MAG: DUF2029 domain-containing protein [Caldilineaceae bacterium]|nr:DUF2029 domain-containing protein [Caldilineaceae bacterium]
MSPAPSSAPHSRRPGWDTLLLALLVFAHLQIVGLAEQAALPTRVQDVLRHPILGKLLPAAGYAAMGDVGPRPGDPIGLLLYAATLGLLLLYFVVDLSLAGRWWRRLKAWTLAAMIVTALVLPTYKLILLRQGSGPASYTHDGGVIQTEATIRYLLEGKNPYREDYTETPMAEWGFSEYRTALYHYPYLPWTFVFSAPFYWAGETFAFYDQRFIYLALLLLALALAPRLVEGTRSRLALVAVLALNPIMGLDVIFGQNDGYVLSWIVFSLVAWRQWSRARQQGREPSRWLLPLSALLFGLACASKPTAWFLAPFYGLLLVQDDAGLDHGGWLALWHALPAILRRAGPALLAFAVLLLPYVLWDPAALYDDVWRWSSGQGPTGYQIWGWGASNFVLALGLVSDRFSQWPFWLLEVILAVPLLIWFMRRQLRDNTLANACWHYGVLLFVFFYGSRFLNENYLGYILSFLAIGLFARGVLSDEGAVPAMARRDGSDGDGRTAG